MKRFGIVVGMVMVLMASGISLAHAAFFDGSNWWMAESQWGRQVEGGNDIAQVNGTDYLGMSGTGAEGYASYRSKWALNMDQNADFSVNFYYNTTTTQKNSGMDFGFMPANAQYINGISIGRGYNETSASGYAWQVDLGGPKTEDYLAGTAINGTFSINYNAGSKMITMSSDETGMTKTYNLTGQIGPGQLMFVNIGGGTDDGSGAFTKDQVYYSNFKLTAGTPVATPEPISSALFLFGGGAMAVRRFRRKK